MNETDRVIIQAIHETPDCTIREISAHTYYSYDYVRKRLKVLVSMKKVVISGYKKRVKCGGTHSATYRVAQGVEFCPTCGRVME